MENNNFFIGYGSFEAFLETQKKDAPLFLTLIEEPGASDNYGMSVSKFVIIASNFGDGFARYFRCVLGKAAMLGGAAFEERKYEASKAYARQAYQLVLNFLIERDFAVEQALISIPQSHRLYDGVIEVLHYDKDKDVFVIKEKQEAA